MSNPIRSSRSLPNTSGRQSQESHANLSSESALQLRKEMKDRQTSEWVRELLRKYLAKYVRDFLSQRKDVVPSPVTSIIVVPDGNGNQGGVRSSTASHTQMEDGDIASNLPDKGKRLAERTLRTGLEIAELTVTEETTLGDDRITYLSRIVSLGVKYYVGNGRPDHSVNWLVKMPSKSFDERNLARVTNVYTREVLFYSKILQDIKQWVEANAPEDDHDITLNVPACYYAHAQDSADIDHEDDDLFPNPEFTLVLDDLRAQGFGKRNFHTGLSFEEAVETIREIAKFHAITWVMTERLGSSLLKNWQSSLVTWQDLYTLYLDMTRQGFRHLAKFRRDFVTQESALGKLVDDVLKLESKLPEILQSLLRPLPPPAVTTLVHMDLWTENLLFKEELREVDEEPAEQQPSTSSASKKPAKKSKKQELDCMILDWQMVTLGRVSHDLAIFMVTSLDGDVRRGSGEILLQYYLTYFENIATSFGLQVPFDFGELCAEFKDSCLLAILLSVTRLELIVSEQSTLQRFFEVLEDLRDLDLI